MSAFNESFDEERPFHRGGRGHRGRGPKDAWTDRIRPPRPEGEFPMGPGGRMGRWRGGFGPGVDPREFGMGPYRARRGQLRESILVLLAEQPRNGYQLMGAIAEKTSGAWTPSPGALYPALAQLVDEGLIAEQAADGAKVYALTDAGAQEAAKQPAEPWADAAGRGACGREQRHGLWEEFRRLGATLKLAGDTATPDQLDAIAKGLADQRRSILRTLGQDAG